MVAFRAVGPVTPEDFYGVLVPATQRLRRSAKDLNFLLILEDSVFKSDFGSSFNGIFDSLRKVKAWNRAAIVSDVEMIKRFAKAYSVFARGRLKTFSISEIGRAISRTSGGDRVL
jgi:hypothetical protein